MNIKSSALPAEKKVPSRFTCDGEDVIPPLSFSDVPPQAKSLVLVMDDPDSPSGTWSHWVVWNISPTTTEVAEGVAPKDAMQGVNDFGNIGYGGPCPGEGVHRYFFTLYALDTLLELPEGADVRKVKKATKGHVLDVAELQGWYERTG